MVRLTFYFNCHWFRELRSLTHLCPASPGLNLPSHGHSSMGRYVVFFNFHSIKEKTNKQTKQNTLLFLSYIVFPKAQKKKKVFSHRWSPGLDTKLNAQAQPCIKLDQPVVQRCKLGHLWRQAGPPGRLWLTREHRLQLKERPTGSKDRLRVHLNKSQTITSLFIHPVASNRALWE